MSIDIGKELAEWRRLLDEKERLTAELSDINKQCAAIERRVSGYCDTVGVDTIKVDGVLSVSVKQSLRIGYDKEKWDDLVRWAAASGNSHIVQRRISERPVKELIDTLGHEFPAHLFTMEEFNKVSTRRI
jgi:hypothetical protein